MAKPWSALTEVLSRPLPGEAGGARSSLWTDASEAWLETAGRLGLVRLGFEAAGGPATEERWTLAYPCPRAVVRWRAAASLEARDMRADGEEIVSLEVSGGRLVAGAPRGRLPRRADLAEIGRLAAAIARREADAREVRRIRARERRARSAAAAVHDLRGELTRALMWAHRGAEAGSRPEGREGDAGGASAAIASAELESALRGARSLASTALQGELADSELEAVPLRELLSREASAALAAARTAPRTRRTPAGSTGASAAVPALRMRCGARRTALVEPRSFARALRNILTNGIEATARRGGHGAIEVEVRPLAPGDEGAWTDLASAGFDLALEVRDTGVGFAADALRRYLEPTVERHRLEAGTSTGFGSSSVDLALRASGVPLRVRSAPMRGTTVTLFLRSRRPDRVLLEPDVRRARRALAAQAEDARRATGKGTAPRGTPSEGSAADAGREPREAVALAVVATAEAARLLSPRDARVSAS